MKSKKKPDENKVKKETKEQSSSIEESDLIELINETFNTVDVQTNKKRKGFYLSFNARIFVNLILLLACTVSLFYFVPKSFSITKSEVIKYNEKSAIDYKVYLKENDFYKTPYLNKGMAYIASLIDKINIKYDYTFKSNKDSNIDISYEIIAKLVIASQNNDKVFYENDYVLKSEVLDEISNSNNYDLSQSISIDYDYYNNLANQFRSNFAVNTNSYLEVYLKINEKSKENNSYELNNQNKTSLKIPLSLQEINIGLEEKTINNQKQTSTESEFVITNSTYVIVDCVLLLFILVLIIILIRKVLLIRKKTNSYDRYVNRILRGYDRLIVNVKTAPILDNYNIIKVEKFEDLLDVRDNIKEPIKYFVITDHHKGEFFITNHNDLYLYVVKEIDLNNKKIK